MRKRNCWFVIRIFNFYFIHFNFCCFLSLQLRTEILEVYESRSKTFMLVLLVIPCRIISNQAKDLNKQILWFSVFSFFFPALNDLSLSGAALCFVCVNLKGDEHVVGRRKLENFLRVVWLKGFWLKISFYNSCLDLKLRSLRVDWRCCASIFGFRDFEVRKNYTCSWQCQPPSIKYIHHSHPLHEGQATPEKVKPI